MGIKVGIIGCGNISETYFNNAKKFNILELVACADINRAAAQAASEKHGIACMEVDDLLHHREIDLLVNLTIPKAHVPVSMAAVAAGKHVHSEKPLGITCDEARGLLENARNKGVRVGCAPDTFLGGGHQTCRKIIDDGWIGRPVAGTAFMMGHGPESWHPNPFFFYEKGAGPVFDMAPYYLTALVNLLGPVKRVMSMTTVSFPERLATSKQHFGKKIRVQTSTHASGVLEFVNGAMITVIFSWDIWHHTHPCIEIYGSEGSLQVPDPNGFGGSVRVRRPGGEWQDMPLTHGYTDNNRIIGAVDIASAVTTNRPHRASSELAFHVLAIMCAFDDSSRRGGCVELTSTCERPAPLPMGLLPGEID
jgi:predicted dehydrogenase